VLHQGYPYTCRKSLPLMSRLVICQRDGKMKSVLDNRHFVRSKFGRDAGF